MRSGAPDVPEKGAPVVRAGYQLHLAGRGPPDARHPQIVSLERRVNYCTALAARIEQPAEGVKKL